MRIRCLIIGMGMSFSVFGDDLEIKDNEPIKIQCEKIGSVGETHLKDAQKAAINSANVLCKYSLQVIDDDNIAIRDNVEPFARLAGEGIISTFPDDPFTGTKALVNSWQQQVLKFKENKDFMSGLRITVNDVFGAPDEISFYAPPNENNRFKLVINNSMAEQCANAYEGATSCKDTAKWVENAIEPAFKPYQKVWLEKNYGDALELQNSWKDFIENSRYQFPWEVFINTNVFYRNHFHGDALVAPPDVQYFVLHPTVVLEHIYDAEKGSRDDISLAVEWFGANWWKKGVGVSLTSVYRDRSDIDSVGHGFTIHMKSIYSIGWVHRSDGNDSVFLNVDLAEWITDKKEKYKKYQEYF